MLDRPVLLGNSMGETAMMAALIDFPSPADGTNYGGPSMFLVGAKSDYVQPNHHAYIRALFPWSSVLVMADALHWLHAEKPVEFFGLVSRILPSWEKRRSFERPFLKMDWAE
ncbi:hypothetical protein OAJ57_03465 [Alphaproteobacteria bacterium]|nr:hypothetical protein [Alphaproteobacteria bacterium]